MDESWRIPIGSMAPRRRSTEQPRRTGGGAAFDPDDFRDVFGGPPRTVLLRRFSGEFGRNPGASLYDEIFRLREYGLTHSGGGWRPPALRVPEMKVLRMEEGFYDDIFGWKGEDRMSRSRSNSKSKSKTRSNSSSALSSEDRSPPLRRPFADDAAMASFASRLRPITIPSRRQYSSPPSTPSPGDRNSLRMTNTPCAKITPGDTFRHISQVGGFSCCFRTPGTTSLEPSLRRSTCRLEEVFSESDVDSPYSGISSAFPDSNVKRATSLAEWSSVEQDKVAVEEEEAAEKDPYFIEIDGHGLRETAGAAAVDEAIAWAKETFRKSASKEFEPRDEVQVEINETNEGADCKDMLVAEGTEAALYS